MPSIRNLFTRSFVVLTACLVVVAAPAALVAAPFGELAEREMRTLAEDFPGRMAGTAQERAAAEYLADRLGAFGYEPVLNEFAVSYTFVLDGDTEILERRALSQNVVADIPGRGDGLIIVGAHYDTAVARSAEQAALRTGGPGLQGVDDNASGVGVLLELAQRMGDWQPEPTIRFIAFGAEEVGLLGARHTVASLSESERAEIMLMINIDSIVTGDYLYVHAGPSTLDSHPHAAAARDMVQRIAAESGFEVRLNPGLNADYPEGTGCCSDQAAFDEAGIPVINIEATNWRLGDLDGYQQTKVSDAFPAGETWHNADLDHLDHLTEHLPEDRMRERPEQLVQVLLPLLRDLAGR
jgi:alkaline phosphatase isozyme conversion protein